MRRATYVPAAYAALAVAGSLSASPLHPWPPMDQSQPTVLPPVTAQLVRVDVVVTDRRGEPKAGLKREDFAVFEDGTAQVLVQFEAYARPVPGKPVSAASSQSAQAPIDQAANAPQVRFVAVVVDDIHIAFANMVRVREALTRFIADDVDESDQVALVKTSAAQSVVSNFTTDRGLLRKAISGLTGWRRQAEWANLPQLTEYQAEAIERGDTLALALAVQQAERQRPGFSVEGEVRQVARAIVAETVYNSRVTLDTLERVTRGMSHLPGQKVILFVSDGFLTGLTATRGAVFDIRRIIDAGTRAGAVIYSLETHGLRTPPGFGGEDRLPPDPRTITLQFMFQRQGEEAARHAMQAVAAGTGGLLSDESNDLLAALRRMLKSTETYYVLAYEPTNAKRDGAFRRIEVRLPRRAGLRVRARAGYFAAVDRRPGAPSEISKIPEHGTESQSAPARTRGGRLTVIPVRLSADFVSVERGATEVVVSAHADATMLSFVRQGDRYKAIVEMAAVVHDDTGAVATTLPRERLSLDLTAAEHERLVREGIPYQKTTALKPGLYDVRLKVEEVGANALGAASERVEIPDLTTGRLTLSSLFVLRASAAADPPPLMLNQALRCFRPGESLYVQTYAYNGMRDASGRTNLVFQAKILRGGVVVGVAAAQPIASGQPEGPPLPHTSRINLEHLDPGEYELEVTVRDRIADTLVTRRLGFTIG